MREKVKNLERHECKKCFGKAHNILLDSRGIPSCKYCNKDLLWSQVAEHLQYLRDSHKWKNKKYSKGKINLVDKFSKMVDNDTKKP